MKYTYLSICLAALIGLTGCGGKKSIKAHSLHTLEKATKSCFVQQENNITIRAKRMTAVDSRRAFNGINLLNKQVQPIQLSVRNENDFPLTLNEQHIGLNLINAQDSQQLFVEDKTSLSGVAIAGLTAVGLIVGAGLVGFGYVLVVLADLSIGFGGGYLPWVIAGGASIGFGAAMPIIVPVSVASSHTTDQSLNEQGLQNAVGNSLINQLIIEPHTTKDFVLLVKKEDCKDQFAMTVEHQYNSTSFDVMLPENAKKKLRV